MDARKILAILNCGIWGNDFCKHEHEIAKHIFKLFVLANSDKEHQTKQYDASVHHKQTPMHVL